MDDFVCSTLRDWGLGAHIQRFKDEGISERSFKVLNDADIDTLFPTVGPRSIFREEYQQFKTNADSRSSTSTQSPQAAAESQAQPSTSSTPQKGRRKRKLNAQAELSQSSSPAGKQRCDTQSEVILRDVKKIMEHVEARLEEQHQTKVSKFLMKKITDLDTDKKELVGVFGATGAGKSSLINAIIGEKDLLPSGNIRACTAVMIKVEANMDGTNYEADIEFITEEEWKDDLWFMYNFVKENANQENKEKDDDYCDFKNKMSAVYGEDWKTKTPDKLMNQHLYKDIRECLESRRKSFIYDSARELCKNIMKFTRTAFKIAEEERRYWPLVKCATIRVPSTDLLQQVTLVDLPGNGDRNKSRDQMWKEHVGNCSTVWILAATNRAADQKDAWEILESACGLMGNGGECQQIHFICTMSDCLKDSYECSVAEAREAIKEEIKKEFSELQNINRHFSEDCFKVFIVSSDEFLNETHSKSNENEIPELKKILENLNDRHSRALNYVSGAHGILSLIQGANSRTGASKKHVCRVLEENLRCELGKIQKSMDEASEAFEKCLREGVENSKISCDKDLELFLKPTDDGRGFHKILKSVVKNNGIYQPKKSSEMNLNVTLASPLMKSIDKEFLKTFPNKGERKPFNGAINKFSLYTEKLIQKFKDVELQLTFLQTEEEKIKKKLNEIIRDRKKMIYRSLAEAIENNLTECYEKAAKCEGKGSLEEMRNILKTHVCSSKNIMFEVAKQKMLNKLQELKEEILKELEETLKESVELSLKTDHYSIPDFPAELKKVKTFCDKLKKCP
ncbi:Nuclear GTPase SLIP-GC [Channa argus]|uniref:Nuclear GTPase SLIP-GC n=1 Tax=Channa argus TaxID=215402 RepID=A0A6G1Q7W1_CHAAH|nr:Nuclear GTPase SLIP-GC [Channa argus]